MPRIPDGRSGGPPGYDDQIELSFIFEPRTAAERFELFHQQNPKVYRTLVGLAREWIARTGRHRIGIGALFERARWELAIATNDAEYRANNSYRAYYARLIMRQEPDLDGVFELRKSTADEWFGGAA